MTPPTLREAAALEQPVLAGIVAWHIRMRGCDGSADWCELGACPPECPPEADALPLVYAQSVPMTDAQIDVVTDRQWPAGVDRPIYAAHRAYARALLAAAGVAAASAPPEIERGAPV